MDWTFIYLMFFLKLPIAALLWIVWWAVRQTPEPAAPGDGRGGDRLRPRHPRRPLPRAPRRGPHGDPLPPAPQRSRAVVARAHHIPR